MYTSFMMSNGQEIKQVMEASSKNKIYFENRYSIELALASCFEHYAHIKIDKIIHYKDNKYKEIIESFDVHKEENNDTFFDY